MTNPVPFSTILIFLSFSFHPITSSDVNSKGVDIICVGLHCGLQSIACGADSSCKNVLDCLTACGEDTACQFICQWELGRENEKYLKLLTCMGDNECLSLDPTGICYGDPEKSQQSIIDLNQISGDWWILKGLNCGQDSTWSGGFDSYPCQKQSFVMDGTNWVRKTSYCFGKNNICTTPILNVESLASIESPGVVVSEFIDPLYLKMVEKWYFVSELDDQFMMYFWCGKNQASSDSGAVVLSRSRSIENIPPDVENRFRQIASEYGFEYEFMCINDNTNCVN